MRNLRGSPQVPSRFVELRFRDNWVARKKLPYLVATFLRGSPFSPSFLTAADSPVNFCVYQHFILRELRGYRAAPSGYNFTVAFARYLVDSAAPNRSFFLLVFYFSKGSHFIDTAQLYFNECARDNELRRAVSIRAYPLAHYD